MNRPKHIDPETVRAFVRLYSLKRKLTPAVPQGISGSELLRRWDEAAARSDPHLELVTILMSFINGMTPECRAEFAALVWIGQQQLQAADFDEQVRNAANHEKDGGGFTNYLVGKPLDRYLRRSFKVIWPGLAPAGDIEKETVDGG